MELYEVSGKLQVEWVEDVRAIWDKWLSYAVTLEEFREGIMVKGVENAKRHGAVAWIADGSNAQGVFSPDIQNYIATEVFRTFSTIGIKYFISVQPKSALARLGAKRYESQVGPHGIQLVEVASFEGALAFLNEQAKQTA
jgi:hypothetical protein